MRESANFENFAIQSNAERLVIVTHAFHQINSNLTNESGIVITSDIDGKKFFILKLLNLIFTLNGLFTGLGKLITQKLFFNISISAAGGKSVFQITY